MIGTGVGGVWTVGDMARSSSAWVSGLGWALGSASGSEMVTRQLRRERERESEWALASRSEPASVSVSVSAWVLELEWV